MATRRSCAGFTQPPLQPTSQHLQRRQRDRGSSRVVQLSQRLSQGRCHDPETFQEASAWEQVLLLSGERRPGTLLCAMQGTGQVSQQGLLCSKPTVSLGREMAAWGRFLGTRFCLQLCFLEPVTSDRSQGAKRGRKMNQIEC